MWLPKAYTCRCLVSKVREAVIGFKSECFVSVFRPKPHDRHMRDRERVVWAGFHVAKHEPDPLAFIVWDVFATCRSVRPDEVTGEKVR